MKNNKFFDKHQPKLKAEAILRSLLCGLAVGFGANFIASLVTWMLPVNGIVISLAVFVGVTAVASLLFYAKQFRLDDKKNARRIDQLGLDERMITMVELADNDSYIAKAQREDARAALANVDSRQIKIRISKAITVAVMICAILGVGMTAVNILSEYDILPGGNELLDAFVKEQTTVYVKLTYVADAGGVIEGDEEQILVQGDDGVAVTAVADDGYIFKCWSDGYTDPTRKDLAVSEDVSYTAIFVELDEDSEGDGKGQGDKPDDVPGNSSDKTGEDGEDGDPNDSNDSEESSPGGGAWEPNNQVVNGETYYRDVLEEYQDAAEELLQDPDSGLTDEEKELIKKYLGIV